MRALPYRTPAGVVEGQDFVGDDLGDLAALLVVATGAAGIHLTAHDHHVIGQ